MDSAVPMMLPKGIVVNTATIYAQVASYSTVPADKVCEYWHVYTTTNKRLQDPTARRLENFWWHVWSSDRRLLSGRALARIYEDISRGPTIAPLHGPPNRWEGPDAPPMTRQLVLAHLARERGARPPDGGLPPPAATPSDARDKSRPSSRPAAPHPILKKARVPSSGPRPTARVVSPHDSADSADKDSDFPSSGSTANTGLEMPLTSSSRKKPATAPKKFVAASAAARRRPLLPRKTNPHSPTAPPRDGAPRPPAEPRPVSPIPERSCGPAQSSSRPSTKALGKRPAPPRPAASERGAAAGRQSPRPFPTTGRDGAALPRVRSCIDGVRPPPPSRPAPAMLEPPPPMERSRSHNGYGRHPDARGATQGLFTGATASTTPVAAHGTIIDQAGSLPVSSVLGPGAPGEPGPSPPAPASSLLESRLTPTQPGPSPAVPMGRTRSQLTLLLEREKARSGDRPRSKG